MISRGDRSIVMIGPAPELGGGVNAVVDCYRSEGLLSRRNVRYLVSYRGKGPARQLTAFIDVVFRLILLLLQSRVALVHLHSASRGSFWRKSILATMCRIAGVPTVFHVHSGEFEHFYDKECGAIAKAWVRRVLEQSAVVVTVSPTWVDPLQRIAPFAHVVCLANPVDVPAARDGVRVRAKSVLFLGRLRANKGAFDLVRSMPDVLSMHPEAEFTLAGDGELEEAAALASSLGVRDKLHLPGWIAGQAKEQALADADLLVLPSYFEGLPICVLEAMAHGVPVVASRVGGIPDACDEGRAGCLIEPGDVEGLSKAIGGLLADADAREGMAARAFARMQTHFDTVQVCRRLDRLWDEALMSRRRPSARSSSERHER